MFEKLSDKTRTAKILSSRTIHTPVLINLKTESASFLFKLGNDLIELTPVMIVQARILRLKQLNSLGVNYRNVFQNPVFNAYQR